MEGNWVGTNVVYFLMSEAAIVLQHIVVLGTGSLDKPFRYGLGKVSLSMMRYQYISEARRTKISARCSSGMSARVAP